MYIICIKTLQTREENFKALTALHPKGLIARWEEMETEPKTIDGEVISVYEPRFGKNSVSLASNLNLWLKELVQAERVAEISGEGAEGDAQFINTGISLQEQQYVLYLRIKLSGL